MSRPDEVDADELDLTTRVYERPSIEDSDRTFRCPECGNSITIGTEGTEYGHNRGVAGTGGGPRCPRRPEAVDPKRPGYDWDGWTLPGGDTA